MILLSVRDLARQFDAEPVFERVSFEVRPGDKIGLIGPNGAGKSTLLRVLVGLDHADVGAVEKHSTTEIGMLEQHAEFRPDRTLLDEAKAGLGSLYALQTESLQLADQMAVEKQPEMLERLHKKFDNIQLELQRLDAYNLDYRVDEVLHGLGFSPEQYDRPITQFSGGQQNRVLLARLLLARPSVMLLDEPTNHLDIQATEWLENYLASSNQALIVVSHDRYFLDRVSNRILELHRRQVTDYPGNFTAYWNQREERMLVQLRTWEKQQVEIADLEDFIRRNAYGQLSAQAKDREKKLARIERVDKPQDFQTPKMVFNKATRTADCVFEAVDLAQGFQGQPLFEHVTLRIQRGERVGIFGPNGTGKTTLLRTLLGELPPMSGKVRLGAGVMVGYFDQKLDSVDPNVDLIEAIRPAHRPEMTPAQLRDVLARFGLRGDIVFQKVSWCSGGERSKVALARLSLVDCNVLVLDEPTNHLDVWACESLEEALKAYEGTLLFVSHDRYFLDRVATHVLSFDANNVEYFEGNYSEYHALKEYRAEQATASSSGSNKGGDSAKDSRSTTTKEKSPTRKRKFPYRKTPDLEREIAEKEAVLEQLKQDLVDPAVLRDGLKAKQVYADFEALQQELAQLYEHWEEAVEMN